MVRAGEWTGEVSANINKEKLKLSESSIEGSDPITHAPDTSIEAASASALAAILGDGLIPAKVALLELSKRNKALLDGGDDAIIDALSRQAVVLEALFFRLVESAGNAKSNDVVGMALKAATSTQKALLHTLGALRQIRQHDA